MIKFIKKAVSKLMDWALYTVLNEKQKKAISNLLTDSQKNMLRKLTRHGKMHEQKHLLKQLRHHLYTLGFTDKTLAELEELHLTSNDAYLKRMAAWELVQWHANKYTKDGARQALEYLPGVIDGESDPVQLRRAAIIKAECHDILDQTDEGKRVIEKALTREAHPDLYLAYANLEESIAERTNWINQAMGAYHLQPVFFQTDDSPVSYDDLQTKPVDKVIENGPKVSVILPAFNAEDGISTAIESILNQTWQNIELLVVDDCSPDNTKDVVREYMKQDARITLLSTPENSGPYIARNIALKAASGDYVTINDSDDWSHAEKIEIQATHLKNNRKVIANTSEHARLTDELKLYRRGTPGRYIFANMSSIMFRRKPVLKKIGYWDSVRFAADGEFKRRLIKAFGQTRYVDLKSGPLSLPRQSAASLTGSSAFGYNGFFKGVRLEYVESLEHHHRRADSLYYPYPQSKRPFPVPEPMWPNREEKSSDGRRHFDVVAAADFRLGDEDERTRQAIRDVIAQNKRIGLIQMYHYDLTDNRDVSPLIRDLIDGDQLQMVVYGEKISTNKLIIMDPTVLEDWQQYVPNIAAEDMHVMADRIPGDLDIDRCRNHLQSYFGQTGTWHMNASEFSAMMKDGKKVTDDARS
ncbi:glycosyltransferase family 2 protein [Lentibacillus sp. CBA3610]|uniref:glycosyltransferase family 2 protein n=1 Tax=Lentibacillus sp. CBA3610 TaxID=2518176 RepID=UPI001595ED2A|nr:glycosyltransferase family 2 protein [Lentibacillus sp. CBA3610]QKY70434.1 glycosyltransferase family 2 protein [Lentibacillus sp. CBA3610]